MTSRPARLVGRLLRAPRTLEAAALLVATRIGLSASPRRLAARMLKVAGASSDGLTDPTLAREVARTIERAAAWTPDSTCLSRAVTGWLMLRRRGIASTVRLGARRGEDGVHMHAWLEAGGTSLVGGAEADRFVPFTR